MVRMNRLNPIHNQVEPLIASIERSKIASGLYWSKLAALPRLPYNPQFLKGSKQCSNN